MNAALPRPDRSTTRLLPAVAAVAVLGTAVAAGVAGGFGGDDGSGVAADVGRRHVTTTAPPVVETVPTTAPIRKTTLAQTLGEGSFGNDVEMVQNRLKELGFDPGPIDGQFGGLTRAAIWAFEKLVLRTPREQATGRADERGVAADAGPDRRRAPPARRPDRQPHRDLPAGAGRDLLRRATSRR